MARAASSISIKPGVKYSRAGEKGLEITGEQGRFTDWMYGEIAPYVKGHVLEIGSGLGTYSERLLKRDSGAVFSDVDSAFVRGLKRRFPRNEALILDMSSKSQIAALKKRHRFDTIIFLNVLEHVKNDEEALRLMRSLLSKNGRIICLVPTHPFLYNTMDKSVGHYRRYTKKEISAKIASAGFFVEKAFYFNAFAIPGWYLGGLLKRNVVPGNAMRLFNTLVPVFRFIERNVLFRSIGISTIVVARRK